MRLARVRAPRGPGAIIRDAFARYGLPEPYERLKALTRGARIDAAAMQAFVEGLTDLPADARERLLALTPGGYTGLAADLARKA